LRRIRIDPPAGGIHLPGERVELPLILEPEDPEVGPFAVRIGEKVGAQLLEGAVARTAGSHPLTSGRSRIVIIVASMVATSTSRSPCSMKASARQTVIVRPERST